VNAWNLKHADLPVILAQFGELLEWEEKMAPPSPIKLRTLRANEFAMFELKV
jgi:hypothetical protein